MIKGYQIAMFLFILNLSVAMMSEMALFGSAYPDLQIYTNLSGNWTYEFDSENNMYYMAYDDQLAQTVNYTDFQMTGLDEASILDVLVMFGRAMYNSTAYLPFFLNSLGIPPLLSALLTLPCWLAYGVAVLQIIRGVVIED